MAVAGGGGGGGSSGGSGGASLQAAGPIGTPGYIAPEILRGEQGYDERAADIYSLGKVSCKAPPLCCASTVFLSKTAPFLVVLHLLARQGLLGAANQPAAGPAPAQVS
eukprot:SAG22_NODE_212_length_15072_cov_3.109197_11_plen_108_part_00